MSNPVLELHLKAEGVDQVKNLTAALKALNGEVGNLGQAKTQLAQLREISNTLNSVRTDLKQGLSEIKEVLTKGLAGAMKSANTAAVKGMTDVQKTFDDTMKRLTETISRRNEEIARRTTELNAGVTKQMAAGGAQAGAAFTEGLEKAVGKVRISFPAVSLGGGAKATYSIAGIGNLAEGRKQLETLRQNVAAQAVIRAEEATMMDQAVRTFRALQQEKLLAQVEFEEKEKARWLVYRSEQEARMSAERFMMQGAVQQWKALQAQRQVAMEASYAKDIAALEKNVAAVMKAATSPARDAATYVKWWDKVITDMEQADARLAATYAKEIVDLDKQVERVMKAATQAPNTLRGKGYIAWWDQVITDMDVASAQIKAKMAEEATAMDQAVRMYRQRTMDSFARSVRGSVGQAMGNVAGPYSSISGSNYGKLIEQSNPTASLPKPAAFEESTSKLGKLSSALGLWTRNANDAHSAARGLASGFNLLWLTWGNLLPLMAGAAVSNAFVQMIKLGADVQQNMATIRTLSEESAQSVGRMNEQLLDMARNGPFGPREIAEAMKTLSLAGLEASQVMSATGDVLNFAIAGDTTIQKAADVMTTVGVAFKIGADGYNYIGDVIAKTAAVSKASVESIGEAFKTASVVNQQYGASLTDVGVGLALLNNAGIQGTAAGTALRNMYVDILGRTPKVQKALRAIGLDAEFAFDKVTGKAKDFVSIYRDLSDALDKVSKVGQTKALQDIFSERGGKEAVQALATLREKAKQSPEDFASELDRLQSLIKNSYGFMAISAAEMSLTATNQMKSVVASLQASLVASFDSIQPYILNTSMQLRDVFNSDQFQSSLQKLGEMVGSVTTFLASHLDVILKVGTAYLGLKIVGTLMTMYEGFVGKVLAVTAAMRGEAAAAEMAAAANSALAKSYRDKAAAQEAAAAATTGAAAATSSTTSALGSLLMWGGRLLGFLGLAVTAWQLYSFWTDKAHDSGQQKVDQSGALLQALKAEGDRLKEVNDAKALGISLDELRMRKQAEAASKNAAANAAGAGSQFDAEAAKLRKLAGNVTDPATRDFYLKQAQMNEGRAALARSVAGSDQRQMQQMLDAEKARVQNEARIQAERVEAENRATLSRAGGAGQYDLSGGSGSGAKKGKDTELEEARRIAEARQQLRIKEDDGIQKFFQDQDAAQQKAIKTAQDAVKQAEHELEIRGLTKTQVEELTLARLEDSYAAKAATAGDSEAAQGQLKVLSAQIEAQKQLVEIAKRGDLLDANEKAAKAAESEWKHVGNALVDNLMRGGKNAAEYLKDLFRTVVLRPMLQPVGTALASVADNVIGSPGGKGLLGSIFGGGGTSIPLVGPSTALGNLTSGLGSIFGFGGSGATFTGANAAGLAGPALSKAALDGTMSFGANSVAGASSLGTSGLSTLSTAMPYIAGAVAIYSVAKSLFGSKGGPKTESGYGMGVPLRGDPSSSKTLYTGIQDEYAALAKAAGASTDLGLGLFTATDPKGTAKTQLAVEAALNGKSFYSRNARLGGIENVGRSEDELKAALGEETQRVILGALQASDVKGLLGDYIRSLGDLDALGGDALSSAYERVKKALTEKTQLEARLADLTDSALTKLNKQRETERASIDATNQALLNQVYAQEDLNSAASALVDAYNQQQSEQSQTISQLQEYARQLREFVRTSMLGDDSPLSVFQKLAVTAKDFNSTLAAAKAGDADARGNLTGRAGDYISSLKNTASSRVQYATEFARVMSELTLEAAGADAKATEQRQLLDTAKAQLEALGLLNTTVKSFADAWADYNNAKANLAAASVAAQAAQQSYTPGATMAVPGTATASAPTPIVWQYLGSNSNGDNPNGYASGGYHAGGWRWVGENGPELAYTGPERIFSNRQSKSLLAGALGGGDGDMPAWAVELIRQFEGVRAEVQAVATHNYFMRKALYDMKDRGVIPINNPDGASVLKVQVVS